METERRAHLSIVRSAEPEEPADNVIDFAAKAQERMSKVRISVKKLPSSSVQDWMNATDELSPDEREVAWLLRETDSEEEIA
ncbi:MAG TPA: hypothetical protein PLD54_01470, partial [Candidatus Levybacteria bacterium]|nr:hypothetical protein [Candidatus Levybacteria bacterium]